MGCFDTIILGGPADALLCAHGHEIRELQTKDLGALMNTYYVWDGILYRTEREGQGIWAGPRKTPRYRLDGDRLLITHEQHAAPAIAGEVTVYTSCEACLPVLIEARNSFDDSIREQFPWVQFVLCFEGSRLVERRPDRVESREDVRKKHPGAIPDDDRLARRYFERRLGSGSP